MMFNILFQFVSVRSVLLYNIFIIYFSISIYLFSFWKSEKLISDVMMESRRSIEFIVSAVRARCIVELGRN